MPVGQILQQDISPWYVGQTSPAITLSVVTSAGAVVNLTGATAAEVLIAPAGGSAAPAVGTVTLSDLAAGQVIWQPAAQDVATAGTYRLYLQVTMPNGPMITDPADWIINELN